MIILSIALVTSSTSLTLNWDDVYASGDTRRIRVEKVSQKKSNGLPQIIAKIKRENGIKS